MTEKKFNALKADFLEWSGGFEPETDEDIDVYVAASMPFHIVDEDARISLRQWMNDSAESRGIT
ncbi:MAG: hypothetical protein JWN24_4625 [Phycisphaerales bacterium]|nr:hypothetical protein [Phycisphaerales bacterium]